MAEENETSIPKEISVAAISPAKGGKIKLLGSNKNLKWKRTETDFSVTNPDNLRNNPPSKYAWVLKISKIN